MSDPLTLLASELLGAMQWWFLGYFVLLNGGYILLSVMSLFALQDYLDRHSQDRKNPANNKRVEFRELNRICKVRLHTGNHPIGPLTHTAHN